MLSTCSTLVMCQNLLLLEFQVISSDHNMRRWYYHTPVSAIPSLTLNHLQHQQTLPSALIIFERVTLKGASHTKTWPHRFCCIIQMEWRTFTCPTPRSRCQKWQYSNWRGKQWKHFPKSKVINMIKTDKRRNYNAMIEHVVETMYFPKCF